MPPRRLVLLARRPSVQHFAATGGSYLWYGTATSPNAAYDSATNKVWVAFQAWDGVNRYVAVTTWSRSTKTWGTTHKVHSDVFTDDHGVPSLVRDHQGHWHVFFGRGNLRHYVTLNPDDPTCWVARSELATYTYPHPSLIGSTIYLFLFKGTATGPTANDPLAMRQTTSLSGGLETWSAETVIADGGTDSRMYQGGKVIDGSRIYLTATKANGSDTFRRNVYFFDFNSADGSVANADGSVTVAAGSLPISEPQLSTDFAIVTQETGTGTMPAICLDNAGQRHVLYEDGAGSPSQTGTFNINHITFSEGAWSSPVTVGTATQGDSGFDIVPTVDGGVQAYWTHDDGSGFNWGGSIYMAKRSLAGAWGAESRLQSPSGFPLIEPVAVAFSVSEFRVIWGEAVNNNWPTPTGTLKGWGMSESGSYVRRTSFPTAANSTILNPTDKTANIVLSNGNLTAKTTTSATTEQVRVSQTIDQGYRVYLEFVIDNVVSATLTGVGLANIDLVLGNRLTQVSTAAGYFSDGTVKRASATIATLTTFTTGDNIGFAIDARVGVRKWWIRKNGGEWHNDVIANQDPENGVGGTDISALLTHLDNCVFAAIELNNNNAQISAKLAASSWTYAAPSGFTQIGPQ